MLGIRHFENKAIDLWQGPPSGFVCDVLYSCYEHAAPATAQECVRQALTQLAASGLRHLAIVAFDPQQAEQLQSKQIASLAASFMAALHQGLSSGVLSSSSGVLSSEQHKRISFVLPTTAAYDAFQDALFAEFLE